MRRPPWPGGESLGHVLFSDLATLEPWQAVTINGAELGVTLQRTTLDGCFRLVARELKPLRARRARRRPAESEGRPRSLRIQHQELDNDKATLIDTRTTPGLFLSFDALRGELVLEESTGAHVRTRPEGMLTFEGDWPDPDPDVHGRSVMEEELPNQELRNRELATELEKRRIEKLRNVELAKEQATLIPMGSPDSKDELGARVDKYEIAAGADPWKHRSSGMKCSTCMWYVAKKRESSLTRAPVQAIELGAQELGRCRRHAPTMNGYPAVFPTDWCGDHKLDETKL